MCQEHLQLEDGCFWSKWLDEFVCPWCGTKELPVRENDYYRCPCCHKAFLLEKKVVEYFRASRLML